MTPSAPTNELPSCYWTNYCPLKAEPGAVCTAPGLCQYAKHPPLESDPHDDADQAEWADANKALAVITTAMVREATAMMRRDEAITYLTGKGYTVKGAENTGMGEMEACSPTQYQSFDYICFLDKTATLVFL